MYPVLFEFNLPEFLQGIFGPTLTIYSYGFFIVLGAIGGVTYLTIQGKKQFNIPFDDVNTLFLLLLAAGYIGGKFFLIFENPDRYLNDLKLLLGGRGFVFYGSLLFCIPTMLIYFRKKKWPVLPMLDIMAVTTCIVHMFGRMGCFMAGCCHGIEWHGPLAVIFTDERCLAPLNTPLHPTQLYSVGMIGFILVLLLVFRSKNWAKGQLFFIYLILYSTGRIFLEEFRGDISRGYVIDDVLSNAQLVGILIILLSTGLLIYIRKKQIGR